MLKKEEKITDSIIENMMGWHHSGFNVYCGERIWPSNNAGLERLAQYIVRAPISQERMIYIPAAETKDGVASVIYESKDGKGTKTFTALDWLAQLVSHIPNKGEQLVRYYGYYSNKSRGQRKKAAGDELVPSLIEAEISTEEFRRNSSPLDQEGVGSYSLPSVIPSRAPDPKSVPYCVTLSNLWVFMSLTSMAEYCYTCSREKQIPIFYSW